MDNPGRYLKIRVIGVWKVRVNDIIGGWMLLSCVGVVGGGMGGLIGVGVGLCCFVVAWCRGGVG